MIPPLHRLCQVKFVFRGSFSELISGTASALSEYYGMRRTASHHYIQRMVQLHTYVVRHGDSLSSIAQKFGIRADALAGFNSISAADRLYVGQVLLIPVRIVAYKPGKNGTQASALRLLQAREQDRILPSDTPEGKSIFYFNE